MEAQGYDYFWRPSFGDDVPPFYAWFIKRDVAGNRTHYLVERPEIVKEYGELKRALSEKHRGDRVAYTRAKTDFIVRVTEIAIKYYGAPSRITERHMLS